MVHQRAPAPGTVAWLDLLAPDVESTARFYAAVLGWTYSLAWTPLGDYRVVRNQGRDVAGLLSGDPVHLASAQAAWEVFVEVESISTTLAAVCRSGGAVLQEPLDVPGGGRVGVFADPTEAVLAVVESPPGAAPPAAGAPGGFAGVELRSQRPASTHAFYCAVLGWRAVERSGQTVFLVGRRQVAELVAAADDAESLWLPRFAVRRIESAIETAVRHDGVVLAAPGPSPGRRRTLLRDPGGARFVLVEHPAL
ncbi:VOC family protein [Pseudonocardia hispaniensis]|uniref:VOC family protein n=1 Tax=Pseudonocardia hispaniensis TaxID=904933 RepID=A0ABW1J5A8_9PSEU